MTIFDYGNLPTITINYILRDEDNEAVGVNVKNMETKESTYCTVDDTSFFYDGYFTIDVTEIQSGINVNSTLLVSAIDSDGNPIYRDIVIFDDRMDTEADYEQDDTDDEYIFAS